MISSYTADGLRADDIFGMMFTYLSQGNGKDLIPKVNAIYAFEITKTKGGILLPESKQEQLNFGVVIAVGPGRTLDNGTLRPCSVKEGETVLLPEYGGNKVTLGDNQDYFLYRDDDLMGTLSDPTK